jgi:AAA domain
MPDSIITEKFVASPARRDRVGLSIALAGASGSGKTKSALELATGMAGPDGRIVVIDTEGRRALHYATHYRFDHLDFQPPYTPERCTKAIVDLQTAGYDVVIFDSASDEYEGEGGLHDIHQAEAVRMATFDGNVQEWKVEAMSAPAWKTPKNRHKNTLIRRLRAYPGFVIFCLRAEEKVRFEKVKDERTGREKTAIVPAGWIPICEKRFMYDMTLSLTLAPETKGKPRFDLTHKITDDHLPFFPEGEFIGRRAGELLRAWATGAELPKVVNLKWTTADAKTITFKSAAEWRTKVVANIGKVAKDQLEGALARNLAELNERKADHQIEADAILKAFADRGVVSGGQACQSTSAAEPHGKANAGNGQTESVSSSAAGGDSKTAPRSAWRWMTGATTWENCDDRQDAPLLVLRR